MRRVLFTLLPEFVLLDVAGPAEAFRIANQRVRASYEIGFAAPRGRLSASVGLALAGVRRLPRRLESGTIVVVPGLPSHRLDLSSTPTRTLIEWLAEVIDERVTLMCVCAGAVIAARAGCLDHRDCTTHHAHIAELRQIAPLARVHENRIFVEDGLVVTSAGITAGIDLALHLVHRHLGPKVAIDVAREMVVYTRRAGRDPALSPWLLHRNHLHPAVHRVQDAVSADPTADWTARRLAGIACTSPRHLARLFSEHARCSPLDYVQRLRVALARDLLLQTDLGVDRVAERAGFGSARQLRRVWKRWESGPPTASRAGLSAGF